MAQPFSIRPCILLCALAQLAVQSLGMHFHRSEGNDHVQAQAHAHTHAHGFLSGDPHLELPQARGHDSGAPHGDIDMDPAATADASLGHSRPLFVPLFLFAALLLLVIPRQLSGLPLRWPRVLVPQRARLYFLHPPSQAPPGRLQQA